MLPPKKDVALALLERSQVFIHLDPRQKGVVVPSHFRKQPQLVLQIGLHMPIPIPDLEIDDDGIGCTLSFNRAPYHCSLPWSCVFALVGDDGRGMVWPDDVPPEVSDQVQAQRPSPAKRARRQPAMAARAKDAPASAEPLGHDARTRLAIVADGAGSKAAEAADGEAPPADESPAEAAPGPAAAAPPRRAKRELPPYLRVVK